MMAYMIVAYSTVTRSMECFYRSVVHVQIRHQSVNQEDAWCVLISRIWELVECEVVDAFDVDVVFNLVFGHGYRRCA